MIELGIIQKIVGFFDDDTNPHHEEERDQLALNIRKARNEWLEARAYFDLVSDPDLVDHAIYLLEAAESKYSYLIKQKKDRDNQKSYVS